MEDVRKIASYICQRYKQQFGVEIDEMKLHKLLYFSQREALIRTDEPLFEAKFKAWRYGPVMVDIRQSFKEGLIQAYGLPDHIDSYMPVFDFVFSTYAPKDSWSLSSITHGEYSWQIARKGFGPEEQCNVDIETKDIKKDAERVKMRRFMLEQLAKLN